MFNTKFFNETNYVAAVAYPGAPEPAFHIYFYEGKHYVFNWDFQFVDRFGDLQVAIHVVKQQILN
jgi:hypothetical protein